MSNMQNEQKHNPFQRKSYPNNRSDGPRGGYRGGGGYRGDQRSGYQSWKKPEPPKEKVLGPEDFPALPTATLSSKQVPDKNSWTKPETSMAERMKEQIENEEAAKLRGQVNRDEEEEDKLDVIPLSNWMRGKYLAKKRAEDLKRREMEAEEENYRWQISPEMVREPDEVFEEPEGDEPSDEEQEEMYVEDTEEHRRE